MGIYDFAESELLRLRETTPDAVILPFAHEILDLCWKFGDSGQSGGSAPYVAGAISQAVKKLLLFQPIGPLTGEEGEWACGHMDDETCQNMRLSTVFKHGVNGRSYFLDAIVWVERSANGHVMAFTGKVCLEDTRIVHSRQFIKSFPFEPKTFYVRLIAVGDMYRLEDPNALTPVWEYYEKPENLEEPRK